MFSRLWKININSIQGGHVKEIPFLDLQAQYRSIKSEIDEVVINVITEAAFIGGHYLSDFEKSFAEFTGRKYSAGVSSGTSALFLVLKSLGIGSGDVVIVPAFSFIATAEAVTWVGARIRFVDVKKEDLLIDVEKIDYDDCVKAVIPVDIFGKMLNPTALLISAIENEVKLIWDCAQSHGAAVILDDHIKKAGSIGIASCFSFYPGKNLGAYGDGGAVVTDSEIIDKKVRMLSNHGRESKFDHLVPGYNERLDGIQAAVLDVKLKHMEKWNEKRRVLARIYKERFIPIDIWFQSVSEKDIPVYHLFVIQHSKRDELRDFLFKKGISTGIHYPIALPGLKAYRDLGHVQSDFPVAEQAAAEVLSLPIYPEMSEDDVHYVSDAVIEFVKEKGL